jgi:hypothetical protein
MKTTIIALAILIAPLFAYSQTSDCVKVDTVYSTAKFKDLGKRDIRFGVKQMTEDMLSETQVGVRLYCNGKTYEGYGESDTEIRAVMIEVVEGSIPFQKMTLSSALKKAVEKCVSQLQ